MRVLLLPLTKLQISLLKLYFFFRTTIYVVIKSIYKHQSGVLHKDTDENLSPNHTVVNIINIYISIFSSLYIPHLF